MTTYDAGNPGTGFEQAQKCGRVNHVLINYIDWYQATIFNIPCTGIYITLKHYMSIQKIFYLKFVHVQVIKVSLHKNIILTNFLTLANMILIIKILQSIGVIK